MATIDNAYQYYLTTYSKDSATRYDTHKESQLRFVYNSMVKVNKDSPLYKINYSGDIGAFAIDIKEKSRSIQNMVSALSDTDEGIESVFSKKIAQSSDEDVVSAEFIGQASDADHISPIEVQVLSLASPQINRGEFLDSDGSDLLPGSYSFALHTNLNSYEFQYNVNENDDNRHVLSKLMRLINNAGVGLKAEVISNDDDKSALQITSSQTGLYDNETHIFEVLPMPDAASMRAMKTIGINTVAQEAGNASYIIDGSKNSSSSNTVTVNKLFELTFNGINDEDETTTIGFKANADAISDNVQGLVNVYNNIIDLGNEHTTNYTSKQLLKDIEGVAHAYHNELEAIGLNEEDDGTLSIDKNLLYDAITADDASDCFSVLNEFKDSLNAKAVAVSVNPMRYVSKMMVAYKDPTGHNFNAPYAEAPYAGMMLDKIL